MNYAEMSGYEINNRLHNAIACEGKYDLKVEGYKVTWTDKETGRIIETLRKQYDKEFKDYLSSWADAGPIIHKYGISVGVRRPGEIDEWIACAFLDDFPAARHRHKNPLRAAMIVFLMMQEQTDA